MRGYALLGCMAFGVTVWALVALSVYSVFFGR